MDLQIKPQTMTSLEITELTGKKHKHVLDDCRKLDEIYAKIGQPKLRPSSYLNTQNKSQPMYLLEKMQVMDLMTGYSITLRIKVNRRWEELEKNAVSNLPTYAEALRELADAVEREEVLKLELVDANSYIQDSEPKVEYADTMLGSTNSIQVGVYAKALATKGFTIGQNKLYKWLRDNKYLINKGNKKNEPYQQYVTQGLFEVIVRNPPSKEFPYPIRTTLVTAKGQMYFIEKLKKVSEFYNAQLSLT